MNDLVCDFKNKTLEKYEIYFDNSALKEGGKQNIQAIIRVETQTLDKEEEGKFKEMFANLKIDEGSDLQQCSGKTKQGKRCSRRQKKLIDGFCTQHSKQ